MSEPAPHVPSFALLAVSNTLAYSTFGASIPLLPLLLPEGSTVTHSSLVLVAFIVPALFVHPIVSSKHTAPALSLILSCGALFEAVGPLLLASSLLFSTVAYEGSFVDHSTTWLLRLQVAVRPVTARIIVAFAMFLSGLGAAMSQFGLVRLVGERMANMPMPRRRQIVGVHLAVLEACIASGTIVSPVIFALVATTRANVFVPFLISGAVQLLLALYIAFTLPDDSAVALRLPSQQNEVHCGMPGNERSELTREHREDAPTYGSFLESENGSGKQVESSATRAPVQDEETDEDPGVLYALRHPWVWMVLFTMLVSASSASFLRPVLTPRITDDLHGSRMFAASLFSLTALVGVLSESFATTVMSAKLGIRNTVILGLLVCLGGFRILAKESWITVAVILLVAGSSSSLVMTLTDLSQTTHVNVLGISNSLSLLAAFTFSVGEIIGTMGAGLLYDANGSFEDAVQTWSHFLVVACAIVVAPYLMGIFIQCVTPWIYVSPFPRHRHSQVPIECPPLQHLLTTEE